MAEADPLLLGRTLPRSSCRGYSHVVLPDRRLPIHVLFAFTILMYILN